MINQKLFSIFNCLYIFFFDPMLYAIRHFNKIRGNLVEKGGGGEGGGGKYKIT